MPTVITATMIVCVPKEEVSAIFEHGTDRLVFMWVSDVSRAAYVSASSTRCYSRGSTREYLQREAFFVSSDVKRTMGWVQATTVFICLRIQYRDRQLVGLQLTAKLVRAGPWASMYLTTAATRTMGQVATRRPHGLSYTVGWVLRYIKPPRPAPLLHIGIFVRETGKPTARGSKQGEILCGV